MKIAQSRIFCYATHMKYLLIALAVLVVYATFSYFKILYYIHYSKNPDITQTDQNFGSGIPLRYIAAGDSTAVGEGASSLENTYTVKIAETLSRNNTIVYHNVGVIGAKTEDVIHKQFSQIVEFNPDIVTISIGANDNTHLISSDRIYENYQEIIKRLLSETKAKIYITNIPNFTGAELLPRIAIATLEHRSKSLNPKLLALENAPGNERVKIINIHDFGWDKFPDRSVTYSLDYFHPSDIGYQNWADAFLSKML